MPDTQSKSGSGQNVPLADLLAVKRRNERLEKELARVSSMLKAVNTEDVSDQDVKAVRELLISQNAEIEKVKAELDEREDRISARESVVSERDKTDSIRSLTEKYGPKGGDKKAIETFEASLKASEDPEKEALKLYAERTNKESEPNEEPLSAEDVFETNKAGGKVTKSVLDMDEKELKAWESQHMAKV